MQPDSATPTPAPEPPNSDDDETVYCEACGVDIDACEGVTSFRLMCCPDCAARRAAEPRCQCDNCNAFVPRSDLRALDMGQFCEECIARGEREIGWGSPDGRSWLGGAW
jgi:hypothetical protein